MGIECPGCGHVVCSCEWICEWCKPSDVPAKQPRLCRIIQCVTHGKCWHYLAPQPDENEARKDFPTYALKCPTCGQKPVETCQHCTTAQATVNRGKGSIVDDTASEQSTGGKEASLPLTGDPLATTQPGAVERAFREWFKTTCEPPLTDDDLEELVTQDELDAYRAGVAAERERCAKIEHEMDDDRFGDPLYRQGYLEAWTDYAAAIRSGE